MSKMETRTVEEVKIFKLILNDMRSLKVELGTLTPHISFSRETMEAFIRGEKNEGGSWVDHLGHKEWHKVFRKGSELEWYNCPEDLSYIDSFGHGISFEWIPKEELELLESSGRVKNLDK
jgi:hypothetical protein